MMRWVLERVSEPEIEPVTAAEFVRNVGEFTGAATTRADDINRLIAMARRWVEHDTGRALIDQSWRLTLSDVWGGSSYDSVAGPPPDGWYCGTYVGRVSEILLRRSPVIAITSFVSVDAAGEETAIDPTTYELREADSKRPRLVGLNGASWTTGTYRIGFRAGYADRDVSPAEGAEKVPGCFLQAILLHAQAYYDTDEKMMDKLIDAAAALVQQERCGLDFA